MNKKELKGYEDSSFPWAFALCIFALIPLSVIISFVGVLLGGIASLIVNMPLEAMAASGDSSISPDTMSLIISIVYRAVTMVGALALAGYCINIIGEHMYEYYGTRTRSSLLIILAIITSIVIISELLIARLLFVKNLDVVSMFGLNDLISKIYEAELVTNAVTIVIKSTFLCIPLIFLSLVVKLLVMNHKYTCKHCKLTNTLHYNDKVISSNEKTIGYWEDGGYRTDNYKINSEDFSVTYQASPTYKTKRVGYIDKKHDCSCWICRNGRTWVKRYDYEA